MPGKTATGDGGPTSPGERVEAAPKEEGGGRVTWLDPSAVKLFRDAAGHARATFRSGDRVSAAAPSEREACRDRSVLRPVLFRAFPITSPDTHVELREEGGKSIGMLRSLSSLDRESRKLAEELLKERYLVPVIGRIMTLRHDFGGWFWEVETDRGERSFTMKSPRDDIRQVVTGAGGGRVRIEDVHGNTYEISDLAELDARSRSLYSRIA